MNQQSKPAEAQPQQVCACGHSRDEHDYGKLICNDANCSCRRLIPAEPPRVEPHQWAASVNEGIGWPERKVKLYAEYLAAHRTAALAQDNRNGIAENTRLARDKARLLGLLREARHWVELSKEALIARYNKPNFAPWADLLRRIDEEVGR